jgi:phenylacetate-coenzyme A ligase PaaK-like adenylate-forming protein
MHSAGTADRPNEMSLSHDVVSGDANVLPGLAARLESTIKRELGMTIRILLLPCASLPRTEGKTRRVAQRMQS